MHLSLIRGSFIILLALVISTQFINTSINNHHQIQPLNGVEYDAWSGTAWFINSQGYIATANHVVADGKKFSIQYKGKMYPAYVVATDKTHDVAILKTNIKPTDYLSISSDRKQGEKIGIYGYPGGTLVLTMTRGTVNYGGVIESDLYTHAKSCHGNSGGPIINGYGLVVGMLNWGFSVQDVLCTSEGGGPDISYLTRLAAKNGVIMNIVSNKYYETFQQDYYQYHDDIVYIQGEN